MGGAVIGKRMNLGWYGKISRDGDAVVINRVVDDTSGRTAIPFGGAVFLNDDNTVRNYAANDTVAKFVGIAVATVVQHTDYTANTASYALAKGCDILTRGTIIVEKGTGTPTAGGKVYYNTSTKKFDTAATAGTTIEIPASFTTGYTDSNGGVEIVLKERNLI